MKDDCPCRTCTAETGRAPGCHSAACPHGWYDWDQAHKERRAAERAARQADEAQRAIAVDGYRKRRKARGECE